MTKTAKANSCDPNDPLSPCFKPQTTIVCSETQFLDEQTGKCLYLQIYFGHFEALFDVQLEAAPDPKSGRRMKAELLKKTFVSATDREFVVQLKFKNPLEVTPNDLLRITTDF